MPLAHSRNPQSNSSARRGVPPRVGESFVCADDRHGDARADSIDPRVPALSHHVPHILHVVVPHGVHEIQQAGGRQTICVRKPREYRSFAGAASRSRCFTMSPIMLCWLWLFLRGILSYAGVGYPAQENPPRSFTSPTHSRSRARTIWANRLKSFAPRFENFVLPQRRR